MKPSEIVIKTLQKTGKPMKSGEIAEMAGMNKTDIRTPPSMASKVADGNKN